MCIFCTLLNILSVIDKMEMEENFQTNARNELPPLEIITAFPMENA